jgi:hypothetical protein
MSSRRNFTPAARSRVASALMSDTSKRIRFQPPGTGFVPLLINIVYPTNARKTLERAISENQRAPNSRTQTSKIFKTAIK